MKIPFYCSIKPNSIETAMEVNQPETLTTSSLYAERATKSFSSSGDAANVFTESICKKAESENLSLEQLQKTLRNIQVIIYAGILN